MKAHEINSEKTTALRKTFIRQTLRREVVLLWYGAKQSHVSTTATTKFHIETLLRNKNGVVISPTIVYALRIAVLIYIGVCRRSPVCNGLE